MNWEAFKDKKPNYKQVIKCLTAMLVPDAKLKLASSTEKDEYKIIWDFDIERPYE
jgi:hypothetical protein